MARKYRGVSVRGEESIQIEFMFKGKRCREIINLPPTAKNLAYSNRRRISILSKIERGDFDYSTEFPKSRSAIAKASKSGCHILVKDALNDWLVSCQKRHAYSTVRDYNSAVGFHLEPRFGHYTLDELNRQEIETWINGLEISAKRINNVLTPLRQVMEKAYLDELIDSNPLDRVKNLKVHTREPEPFTLEEISGILSVLEGSPKYAIQFGFWTGVRTSELLGLRWAHVAKDFSSVDIQEALVHGRVKEPKTKAGRRKIFLHITAKDALLQQRALNISSDYVFIDPISMERWASDQPFRKRVWIRALKAARIKYRECYQMRHTFASQMLSNDKNPLWLASQMGHSDWGMIRKIYGKWIDNGQQES